jgi:AbrB family looped-hinge helix DNA binding protein
MNIGHFTTPNTKGQIVLPKSIRDALGITERVTLNIRIVGDGVYIQPVTHAMSPAEYEGSYLNLLSKTKGAWSEQTPDEKKRMTNKTLMEISASKKRKKLW